MRTGWGFYGLVFIAGFVTFALHEGGHWLAALAFGLALTAWLGASVDIPKPPSVSSGFGFPSIAVTMSTITFGFFAVLIARELPGRTRVWPYLVSGIVVSLIGFARLYLGAHWLSDVLAGILLGLLWIAALGIAYRRRVVRSFWVRPTATIFFVAILGMATWHGSRSADDLLARFDPPLVPEQVDGEAWWTEGWQQQLPARRNELHGRDAWPLNVQLAGPLDSVRARLLLSGWENYATGGWYGLLQTLDKDVTPHELPVLSATHQGRGEVLVMARRDDAAGRIRVLRLWASPVLLQPGDQPLWIGTVQELEFTRRLDFFSYWRALPGEDALLDGLRHDVGEMESALDARADDGQRVLRLRAPQAPAG